jgi:hypothetical protein
MSAKAMLRQQSRLAGPIERKCEPERRCETSFCEVFMPSECDSDRGIERAQSLEPVHFPSPQNWVSCQGANAFISTRDPYMEALSRGRIEVFHQPHVGFLLANTADNLFSVRA